MMELLVEVFLVRRTVADRSGAVLLVVVGCAFGCMCSVVAERVCELWVPCVLLELFLACSGGGFSQNFFVFVSVLLPSGLRCVVGWPYVLVECAVGWLVRSGGLSQNGVLVVWWRFSQNCLVLFMLVVVLSLKICVDRLLGLFVLVELSLDDSLSFLVEVLSRTAYCLVVRFEFLGYIGGTAGVPVARMVLFRFPVFFRVVTSHCGFCQVLLVAEWVADRIGLAASCQHLIECSIPVWGVLCGLSVAWFSTPRVAVSLLWPPGSRSVSGGQAWDRSPARLRLVVVFVHASHSDGRGDLDSWSSVVWRARGMFTEVETVCCCAVWRYLWTCVELEGADVRVRTVCVVPLVVSSVSNG
ncbi:hypothetical protein Taro_038934 [Colocasia esculenta]|uniref:Uncharacterized protein n=1 Tax=Colocasia esculenta TaxID=4460 RepID=A0A843WNN8_COLES|nr:hypothetical protein [Colocasia esculenta]